MAHLSSARRRHGRGRQQTTQHNVIRQSNCQNTIEDQMPNEILVVHCLILDEKLHLRAKECRRCEALYVDCRNA